MGRVFTRFLVLACVSLAALGAVSSAHAAESGVVSDLNWGIPVVDQEREVADLRELGAKWVRLHVGWKDFEPSKGVYNDWNLIHTGIAIDQARSAGANVVLMVYDAPAWASGSTSSNVPRWPADYGDFMRYLSSYYRGKVAAYEIWNEQNYQRFWSTGPNAAAYTALLQAAYPAVKAGDANALVLFGGLSRNDYFFVEDAYRAGAKGFFDVMVTHPYPDCGRSPDWIERYADTGRIRRGAFLGYREVRASMLAFGDDKPIWFTELGWSTATTVCNPAAGAYIGGVTEAVQADYVRRVFELTAADPYVQVAMIYNFRNNFWARDADQIEARFGVVRTDFSRKPAFYALKDFGQAPSEPVPAPPPAPAPAPADAVPSVTLTRPTDGSTFSRHIDFAATASDDRGVTKVEFVIDGRIVRTDTSAPYTYRYDGKKLARGAHVVGARAHDTAGNVASATATITRT